MKNTKLIPHDKTMALLDKAEEHLDKSEFAEAEKLANEVLSSGLERKDDEAWALCIIGRCCHSTARYDNALLSYNKALTAAEASFNLSLQSRALQGIANVQGLRDDYKTALGTGEQALALAERAQDKKQELRALNDVGSWHRQLADYPRALGYFTRALPLAEEIGNKHYIAGILGNIGLLHGELGDYRRALDYKARALAIAEEIGNKYFIAGILGNIGNMHIALADYARALDYKARALAIAEEIGHKEILGRFLGDIGTVHLYLADYPRAFDYFTRSHSLLEEIGDRIHASTSLGNLGTVYMETGDYPQALEYFKRALDLTEQIGERRMAGLWMNGIASAQHKLGKLEAAYQGYVDTLRHRRDLLKSNENVADTLLGLGGILLEQGKPKEGLARLEEALTLAEKLGEKKVAADVHKEIANAYSQMGDMANAFEHLKKFLALDKEIFSEEAKKRIETFNMRVAIAEKERETEVERIKAAHFERELTAKALAYASQSELIATFREDLRRIIRKIEAKDPAINELYAKLKELPDGIDWKEFEEQFRQVHPEFKINLSKKFPSLTDVELQISALLRLKLKSPDIGKLLSLSERTVQNHRHRIRKKIGLKAEDDMAKFLQAF